MNINATFVSSHEVLGLTTCLRAVAANRAKSGVLAPTRVSNRGPREGPNWVQEAELPNGDGKGTTFRREAVKTFGLRDISSGLALVYCTPDLKKCSPFFWQLSGGPKGSGGERQKQHGGVLLLAVRAGFTLRLFQGDFPPYTAHTQQSTAALILRPYLTMMPPYLTRPWPLALC